MYKQIKYLLLIVFVIAGCAKRGSISGGLKDTISPILKISSPKNYTTDFTGNSIKLTFDEYIKLKDINKQLIVSPPMKYPPEITPSTASKSITIKIKDTLQPNTTYSFNFGQSITDNNEGNPYRQFKYVFSTGPYIDSLSLSGTIKDAYDKEPDTFVSVALYDANETFNDSIIYKELPRYVTNTLDSSKTFKLENLKAGKYMLVGLKDDNNNFKYNPKSEKIGFHKELITVPNDTLYEIELFKEVPLFKSFKPVQASGNRLIIGYEGNPGNVNVTLSKGNTPLETIITQFPRKDSLQIWYKPIKVDSSTKTDSVDVTVDYLNRKTNFTVKIKNQKPDTLSVNANFSGNLPLRDQFALTASVPLTKVDSSKMQLTNKDSATVAFTTIYDDLTQMLKFDFIKEPLEKYKLVLFPGALTDYMEHINDTLTYKLETTNTSDYGNLRLNLDNVRQFPVIVELTDSKGEVIYSEYSENQSQIDFNLIKPALYTVRVIYDENKNLEWDSGNFLEKRQAEEVIYFPKEIDVRANWDVEQVFNLRP